MRPAAWPKANNWSNRSCFSATRMILASMPGEITFMFKAVVIGVLSR